MPFRYSGRLKGRFGIHPFLRGINMKSSNKHASMFPAIALGMALSTLAFGGEGDKISPFGLSLTVGVKQTDNRDAIPDDHVLLVRGVEERIDKEDDTEYSISPTISFRHEMSDGGRIYIAYSPTYTDSDNPREDSVDSEWTHTMRADADIYLGPRTKFTLSDNYWWSGQKDWHYGEDYEMEPTASAFDEDDDLTRNDDYYNNRLDTSLSRTISADLTARVGAQWRVKRYDDDEQAAYGDEDEYMLFADFMKRTTRHFSYGVFAEYTAFDRSNGEGFEPDPIVGNETPRVDTGVEYATGGVQIEYDISGNGNILFNARTGYKFVWYEAEDIEDDETIGDSRAEFILYKYERTSGRFGLKYGREFGEVYPYSSQDNTTLYANLTRLLDRKGDLRLAADLEYRMRTYDVEDVDPDADNYSRYFEDLWEKTGEDGEGNRDSVWVRLSAVYRWSPKLSTSAFYTYEDVESDVDMSYTENTVGLNATYRFL